MKQKQHHIQDALEHYAVAFIQERAEERGVAITQDSEQKYQTFQDYADVRGLTSSDFEGGEWPQYKASIVKFMPCYLERLIETMPGTRLDFVNVEADYRNANRKGDFLIISDQGGSLSVSLKNYLGGLRPQLSSGTFNSFILGFLFEPDGVGCYKDPATNVRFRGSSKRRNEILEANGYGHIVPVLERLDALNQGIKARFVYSDEFEFLDEARFQEARRECGEAGATHALEALGLIARDRVKARLLKMTGLDGAEELLLLYRDRFADTITVPAFRELRTRVQADETTLTFRKHGQAVRFDFVASGVPILTVDVPFTINKNGAWISGAPYEGKRSYRGEAEPLSYRQRRPRKSKELATSINTYLDLSKQPEIFVKEADCSST